MLNFKNVSLRRGPNVLFSQASFTIHQGQKVGLTGANGAGKSSLFALLRGELHTDEGDFSMPPGLEVAHVAQETPAVACSAIDYVIDGDQELRRLQKQLSAAEQTGDGLKLAELHAALDIIGGYTAEARAARLMNGLGFRPDQEQNPVGSFSGGWRMRLNLAQALMCRSDLLLLDEPTNHLDLDAVIWLQDWLCKYPGTLLLISHDRDFLDAIASHIAHIEQQKIELYTGNYSAFEKMRAEKLAQQQSAFEKQQREIAHIQSFVDRFKAKATKAKQAQSRIKSLERMELIAQAHVDSPFNFSFRKPQKMPNPLLKLQEAGIGYGTTIVIDGAELTLAPGDRIGLLGPNGAGKSSLIKVLAGEMQPLAGEILIADALNIGYFAQHQLEQLRIDESPLQHLQRLDKQATEKDLRNYLGGFDFRGDKVLEPVGPFSGGEKARLVLAILVYQNPNLLLLDEPTNHLDLEMRHALSVALQDYEGAMLIVSHDRHLLRSVTDQLLLVADGKVRPFDGDLDDYRSWLTEQTKNEEPPEDVPNQSLSRKDQRKLDAERRQKNKPLLDALKKAELAVENLHREQYELEQQLADPAVYQNQEKERLKQLLARKTRIDKDLEEAEAEWLEAETKLEEAG
ncbi:ATP-binding cassette domain-containing protein [Methylotuvimicrobium alcaliphilum]|uniref:Probable ATP-binding protein YheS n=1 Tax=Methylotuvimicrobium alcaliphilum (strain DSM 19304 / NCIMB 14124 / VKM B-2133 / 20Z) TaxID=1091494 RepID=G4SW59_META2|nr:ATP-binding cassette domain-containing protein [Methylotuvimicrobium alcaliphilum]CCE22974.1 putative ABC transporter, ATP-binding protein [Methylotuvimicrobium alcaliphilum 20Z]